MKADVHNWMQFTGKKYGEHVFEKLQSAPLNEFSYSGFRLNDSIKTRASEQGLTYTPGQCHRLRQANFLHQTLMEML